MFCIFCVTVSGVLILVLMLLCMFLRCVRCGSSSVMKTRTMAASALVPLISFTDLPAIVEQLVDVIPSRDSEG